MTCFFFLDSVFVKTKMCLKKSLKFSLGVGVAARSPPPPVSPPLFEPLGVVMTGFTHTYTGEGGCFSTLRGLMRTRETPSLSESVTWPMKRQQSNAPKKIVQHIFRCLSNNTIVGLFSPRNWWSVRQ